MMNEQQLEALCVDWFQEVGRRFVHGPAVAPEGVSPRTLDRYSTRQLRKMGAGSTPELVHRLLAG